MRDTEPDPAVPSRRPRLSRRAIGLLTLAVVAVTILFLGIKYLRRTSDDQRCRRKLRYVSQALMNYLTSCGHLPPAYLMDSGGRRMHSWRAILIPFVDSDELSAFGDRYEFHEPWDGPANTRFLSDTAFYGYYSCPVYADGARNADYLCVVGGALWPVPKRRGKDWKDPASVDNRREGGFLPSRGKAILLVEVVESDIPWTKPEDISMAEIALLLREDPGGDRFRRRIRHVVAVDAAGTPFVLDPALDINEIKQLVESEAAVNERLQ